MRPFWIDTDNEFRLAIVPRPRGNDWLEDELQAMHQAGVDVLVSMLPREESEELGLADEGALCEQIGLRFRSFPIPDRQVPGARSTVEVFINELREDLREGRSIAVHCRASIGRSSLILAALLCTEGMSATEAFLRITKARGLQVPDTVEQVTWVETFASGLPKASKPSVTSLKFIT